MEKLGGGQRRSAEVSGQDAGKGQLIPGLRQSLRPAGALTGLSIDPAAPMQDKPEATASRLPPRVHMHQLAPGLLPGLLVPLAPWGGGST